MGEERGEENRSYLLEYTGETEPPVIDFDLSSKALEKVEDDYEDVLDSIELNVLRQQISDNRNNTPITTYSNLNEIIFFEHEEDVDYTQELELVREAMKQNRRLRKMVQDLEDRLLSMKKELHEKLKEIGDCNITAAAEIDQDTDFYTSFSAPYFRDGMFPCPPNADQITKNYIYSKLNASDVSNWEISDISQLEDAIRDTIVAEYLTKAESNKNKKNAKGLVIAKINSIRNSPLEEVLVENDIHSLDWDVISNRLTKPHSSRDCRVMWNLYLKPSIQKGKWNKKEEEALVKIAESFNFQNWDAIAEKLDNRRTGYQCFIHYQQHLAKFNYTWSQDEFQILKKVIRACKINEKDKYINWSKIMFYYDCLNFGKLYCKYYKSTTVTGEDAVKGRFDLAEDKFILHAIKKEGIPLKKLPHLLSNRTNSQIRDRFVNTLSGYKKKIGIWSKEEDHLLMKLVDEYGTGQWAKIATQFKNRSRTQIRQHYRHIKAVLSKNPDYTIETYKRKNAYVKTNTRVRKLIKRVNVHLREDKPIATPSDISKAICKDKSETDLLRFFAYQSKVLDRRTSIGTTFDWNKSNILDVCKLFGIICDPSKEYVPNEGEYCIEYASEALKYVKKEADKLSSISLLGNELTLMPPDHVKMNAYRNLVLCLEDKQFDAKLPFPPELTQCNDPNVKSAIEIFFKRLFVLFSTSIYLKHTKPNDYLKAVSSKSQSK